MPPADVPLVTLEEQYVASMPSFADLKWWTSYKTLRAGRSAPAAHIFSAACADALFASPDLLLHRALEAALAQVDCVAVLSEWRRGEEAGLRSAIEQGLAAKAEQVAVLGGAPSDALDKLWAELCETYAREWRETCPVTGLATAGAGGSSKALLCVRKSGVISLAANITDEQQLQVRYKCPASVDRRLAFRGGAPHTKR